MPALEMEREKLHPSIEPRIPTTAIGKVFHIYLMTKTSCPEGSIRWRRDTSAGRATLSSKSAWSRRLSQSRCGRTLARESGARAANKNRGPHRCRILGRPAQTSGDDSGRHFPPGRQLLFHPRLDGDCRLRHLCVRRERRQSILRFHRLRPLRGLLVSRHLLPAPGAPLPLAVRSGGAEPRRRPSCGSVWRREDPLRQISQRGVLPQRPRVLSAGPDLYEKEADLVVAIICPDYAKKEW